MRTIYTLLLASIIFTSVQSQNVDLSLKLEKGKEYKQTTTSKSTILQEIMGQKINISTTVNGTNSFLVKDINEDGYITEVKYEDLNMSITVPKGGGISSEVIDEKNPMISILNDLKGNTFEMMISKKGKITEVKNFDAIMETIMEGLDKLPDGQKEPMKQQILKVYGDEAIKQGMEMISAIYPDKPLKKGDKWTKNTNLESEIPMEIITDYELVEVTPDYALIKGNGTVNKVENHADIEANGTVDKADNNTGFQVNGVGMKYDISGTIVSEIKVDRNTGWIINGEINQDINIDGLLEKSDKLPLEIKISMNMTNETVITD